eukprot:Pgem_evm1s8799
MKTSFVISIFSLTFTTALSAIVTIDYNDTQQNKYAHMQITGDERLVHDMQSIDYTCEINNDVDAGDGNNSHGVITITNENDFIKKTNFIAVAPLCLNPKLVYVNEISIVNKTQKLHWNTRFNQFSNFYRNTKIEFEGDDKDALVTLSVVMGNDKDFPGSARKALLDLKNSNELEAKNEKGKKFHALVKKYMNEEKNNKRRRRENALDDLEDAVDENIIQPIENVINPINNILFEDGHTYEEK